MKEKSNSLVKKHRTDVHTDTITQLDEFHEGHRNLLDWIKVGVLEDAETFRAFSGLVRPPFKTNELTESIFTNFEKIFQSEQAFRKLDFKTPEVEADSKEYLKKINHKAFWETTGFDAFKSDIDSFLVVDIEAPDLDDQGQVIQSDELPEPYYYLIGVESIHTVDVVRQKINDEETENTYNFAVEYIAYSCGKDKLALIDDDFYRVYIQNGNNFVLQYESPHYLDYCPCKPFWSSPLNSKSLLQKKSPITNSLTELDWLIFMQFAKKYQQTYGMFPIYAMYKAKCTYKDDKNGQECRDGILHNMNTGQPMGGGNSVQKCPSCGDKMKKGPGKTITLRAPNNSDQPNLMDSPLKIISPDIESLEHITSEIEKLEQSIYSNVVGKGADVLNGQAVNESQINGIFESKRQVMMRVKKNFEIIEKFATDTVCKLRYQDNYVGSSIDYGDPTYNDTLNVKIEEYDKAKSAGMPSFHLTQMRNNLYASKYKNDPLQIQRYDILEELEPYQNNTMEELIKYNADAPMFYNENDLILKSDFQNFISRFERENGDIVQFGSKISMDKKINQIKQTLLDYVREQKTEGGSQSGGSQQAGGSQSGGAEE